MDLGNTGSAAFDWEAREKGGRGTPAEIPSEIAGRGARAAELTSSHLANAPTPRRATPSVTGGPVLLLQDILPWESTAIQQVLEANGVGYDVAGSDQMATIDLSAYDTVIISNDQPQDFYEAYKDNASRFDAFVSGGGFLWVETAYFGFGDGDFSGAVLPGGVVVGPPVFDDFNDVVDPDHPLMAGVPDPISGTAASHSVFENVPSHATVIATSSATGEPTLVEWDHGAGHVVGFAQTLEFAWDNGQDGAQILENAVPYARASIATSAGCRRPRRAGPSRSVAAPR